MVGTLGLYSPVASFIKLQAGPGRTRHTGTFTHHRTAGCFLILSQWNMEETCNHAASLLLSLNLQREQAQFCDCVLIQKLNPAQLYPAHRCVLSASSPVLASLLSSTGALVELQAPCLTDSVLALLLDYIYTGALPYTPSQQEYNKLLSVACHLQMRELQETLRAWEKTELIAADNGCASAGDSSNTYGQSVKPVSNYLSLAHDPTANGETRDETDTCRNSSRNGANDLNEETARNVRTSCSVPQSIESSVNKVNYRHVAHVTSQDLIQNTPCTPEVHRVSQVDNKVQRDRLHSAGTATGGAWHESEGDGALREVEITRSLGMSRHAEAKEEEISEAEKTQRVCLRGNSKAEEKQTHTEEDDVVDNHHCPVLCPATSNLEESVSPSQCSSSSSYSPPHPCCGVVTVIRHSSGADLPMPPYNPVSQALVSSSGVPHSRSGSTDDDSVFSSFTIKHKKFNRAQSLDSAPQSWKDIDSSTQAFRHESNASHCEQSHIKDHTDNNIHSDTFQSRKQLRDGSAHEKKFCSSFPKGVKYKSYLCFDDVPSKHQRLDSCDSTDVWVEEAAEEPSFRSQVPRAVVQSPVQDSNTACEDFRPRRDKGEEHSHSRRFPAAMDRQGSLPDRHRHETGWFPHLQRAETSTGGNTEMTGERDSVDVRLSVSATPQSSLDSATSSPSAFQHQRSLELEKFSDTGLPEPHLTFTMFKDNNPPYGVQEPSYRGHLYCHYLPPQDTHFSHKDSQSHHHSLAHSYQPSEEEEEEEVGFYPSGNRRSSRQHFAPGTADQVVLLDISAQPAELFVAHRHRYEEREHENQNKTGATRAEERKRIKFGGETFDENESLSGEEKAEETDSVGKDRAEVIHRSVDGENQAAALTVCSPPPVPISEQTSMSSTSSVCIPPPLSDRMQTKTPTHVPAALHQPFLCSLCDRSFSQRGSLNRHVRSHLGIRPFPCPRCPMTFSRQYRVTEHMRVHQRCPLSSEFQKTPASLV